MGVGSSCSLPAGVTTVGAPENSSAISTSEKSTAASMLSGTSAGTSSAASGSSATLVSTSGTAHFVGASPVPDSFILTVSVTSMVPPRMIEFLMRCVPQGIATMLFLYPGAGGGSHARHGPFVASAESWGSGWGVCYASPTNERPEGVARMNEIVEVMGPMLICVGVIAVVALVYLGITALRDRSRGDDEDPRAFRGGSHLR